MSIETNNGKCESCRFIYCHEQFIHSFQGCKDYRKYGACDKCGEKIEESYMKMPTIVKYDIYLCKECWWKKFGIPGEFCPGR